MSRTLQINKYRKILDALQSRLDARATESRDEAFRGAGGENVGDLSNAPIHLADHGSQESEATVNLALAGNEAALRQEIEEAIYRFDQGTYGICEECQGEISLERLSAVPYARLCIQCAKRRQ